MMVFEIDDAVGRLAVLSCCWFLLGSGFAGDVAAAQCGDGVHDPLEQCDPGGDATTCNASCVRTVPFGDVLWLFDVEASPYGIGDASQLAAIDDLDGDGVDDVVVGDAAFLPTEGRVLVLSGATGTPIWERGGLGGTVGSAGDIDGDGLSEVLASSPGHDGVEVGSGRTELLSGADGSTLWVAEGEGFLDGFGTQVADAGDLDGDSIDDWLVSASGFDSWLGKLYAYSGATGTLLWSVVGEEAFSEFGSGLTGIDDLDGDGVPDVLVSAYQYSDGTSSLGRVYALSGVDGSPVRQWTGVQALDELGRTIARLDDLDGDGTDEFAMAAPQSWPGRYGRVFVHSGATGELLLEVQNTRTETNQLFGSTLASAGDFDFDGIPDVAVGARNENGDGELIGRVQVYSGADGRPLWSRYGPRNFARMGTSIAGLGDLDGDGFADVVVQAAGQGRLYAFAGSPELTLSGPLPGQAGSVNDWSVGGASEGATVSVVWSAAEGSTSVPLCGAGQVELASPTPLGTATADATGLAGVELSVPDEASGVTVHVQAVEATSCRTSRRVSYTFP